MPVQYPVYPFTGGFNGIVEDMYLPKLDSFLNSVFAYRSVMYNYAGASRDSIVWERTMRPGMGTSIQFPKIKHQDYKNPITDVDPVRGNFPLRSINVCYVHAHQYTFTAPQLQNLDLMKYSVPGSYNIEQADFEDMALRHQQWFDFYHFYTAMTGLYSATVNGSMPQPARAVAGNLISGQPADGVYTYAAGQTLRQRLESAMPTARKTQHQPSLAHIMRLRAVAVNKFTEDPIYPSSITYMEGIPKPKFTLLATTGFVAGLHQDEPFLRTMTARGYQVNSSQANLVTGGNFIGTIRDIDIIEVPAMDDSALNSLTNTSGDRVEWCLLLGAGAFGLFNASPVKFVSDIDNIEGRLSQVSRKIFGASALLYPAVARGDSRPGGTFVANSAAGSLIEQSIVHSFTISPNQ